MNLYPHQIKALYQTKNKNHVAYYLDMGLGKTFVGSEKMKQLDADVNLIICQKSKIDDWIEHFRKYYSYVPEFTYDLTRKNRFLAFMDHVNCKDKDKEPCYGVINYDLAFRRPDLLNLDNFTLMLDESSMIQNEKAKRTKFILKMKPKNVILLSGTPTSGKYEKLWSQMHLLGWNISLNLYHKQYINWNTIKVGGVPLKVVDKENPLFGCDFAINMLSYGHELGLLEYCGPTTEDISVDIISYCNKNKVIKIIDTLKRQGYCSEYDVR